MVAVIGEGFFGEEFMFRPARGMARGCFHLLKCDFILLCFEENLIEYNLWLISMSLSQSHSYRTTIRREEILMNMCSVICNLDSL